MRGVCEPFFDRPLKEISLGQVLLRLFQASRRFNVEIQPQLVLLQKTLLNIEGLGRQLDPDLDLWVTAKPFLEKWMKEQVGLQGLRQRTEREAERWSAMLPELPRLTHIALKRLAYPEPNTTAVKLGQLIEENRRTRRWVVVISFLVFLLLVNMLALLIKLWGLFLLPPPGG